MTEMDTGSCRGHQGDKTSEAVDNNSLVLVGAQAVQAAAAMNWGQTVRCHLVDSV